MRRFAVLVAWLVFVWLGLWEEVSTANVLSGIAVALLLLLLFPARSATSGALTLRPWQAVKFGAYFVVRLVEASVIVAWEVVTPRNRIREGIVAVPLVHASKPVALMVAQAVSLTPGTLTIEIDEEPLVLYVHVLHLTDVEQARRDVLRLESLAARAFLAIGARR